MLNWLKRMFEETDETKIKRQLGHQMHLVNEIAKLVAKDAKDRSTLGGFGSKVRIREIGEALNEAGGIDLMRAAYYEVRGRGPYFSEDIWDGIGYWRC